MSLRNSYFTLYHQLSQAFKMDVGNEPRPRSPEKHLFLTLKVDFSKLKNLAPRSKLVILKLNPKKLATFTDKPDDEPMDSSEEEEPEKEEPPLEDRTSGHPSHPHTLTNI